MQATLPAKRSLIQSQQAFSTTVPGRITLVVAASAFVALCAHISLPLPFTPVPLTLSNFAVLLVGLALGPVAGFSALLAYFAEGALGLPVFAPHGLGGVAQLAGPTGGYLLSYPLAAAVAGLARKIPALKTGGRALSNFAAAAVSCTAATVVILSVGALWLGVSHHLSATAVWYLAVAPFLFGEAAKIVAAAGIFQSTRRWLRS